MTGLFARSRNLLLNTLSLEDLRYIEPRLQRVALNEGCLIARQNEPIDFVCFPECGVTSIVDVLPDGSRIEIALIGREGMTNAQLLLGCEQAPHEAQVQIGGGSSLRLEARDLREFCTERPSANALFLRFIHAVAIQTSRTLSSNVRDTAEKRLSRWLLMCHDRIDGDEIKLAHRQIGRMLGVRRATVTDTLHILEGEGALKSMRERIIIRDRARLEAMAGDAYGYAEAHYRRLIAPFGKSAIAPSAFRARREGTGAIGLAPRAPGRTPPAHSPQSTA